MRDLCAVCYILSDRVHPFELGRIDELVANAYEEKFSINRHAVYRLHVLGVGDEEAPAVPPARYGQSLRADGLAVRLGSAASW